MRWLILGALVGCSNDGDEPEDDAIDLVTSDTDVTDTDTSTDTDTTDTDTGRTEGCWPFEQAFEVNVQPLIEDKCGACHGPTPAYGAPYSLGDYADLTAGKIGERKVDAMLEVLMEPDRMPPSNAEQLTHTELDSLVGWVSCGLEHPPEPTGLQSTRPVFEPPPDPPADAVAIELTAQGEVIGPYVLDDYRDFDFTNIVDEPMFIRRIEPVLDDTRVLHHITLTEAIGFPYLYAWAPGTNAIEFPDGGIRLDPDQTLRVEIHYNNGAGVPDAVDSSGIRLWVSEDANIEYGMMSPQSWFIYVPAGQQREVNQSCTPNMDFDIVASMPHMHEIGSTFNHEVQRSDGTIDNIVNLTGWSFESQYFYDTPVHVNAGDTLRMTCGYDNTTSSLVVAGEGTSDEMCFDFMVVTPPSAQWLCAL